MQGRRPKLRVIEGAANPNRCPGPPMWLTLNAKREWRRVAPELHNRRQLLPDTQSTLESYCMAVAQVKEFEEAMIAEGRFITDEAGNKTVHPAHRAQQASMREARLLAAELHLTPARRGKGSGVEPEGKADGWSNLLA